MSKSRFPFMKCNSTILIEVEDIAYTGLSMAYFCNTISHEKGEVLLTDEIYDSGHIEVFNEIFPLSVFGLI